MSTKTKKGYKRNCIGKVSTQMFWEHFSLTVLESSTEKSDTTGKKNVKVFTKKPSQ